MLIRDITTHHHTAGQDGSLVLTTQTFGQGLSLKCSSRRTDERRGEERRRPSTNNRSDIIVVTFLNYTITDGLLSMLS